MDLAAGQPPEQEGVDGAERQLAALGARARAGHVVEHPRHLGAGEIRIEQQAGLRGDRGLMAVAPSARAQMSAVRRSCQTMAWWTGLPVRAIPHDGGLALVGDADGGDVARALTPALRQRLAQRADGACPDVLGVVLDPAGGGKMLREFLLRRAATEVRRNTMAREEVVP